MVDRPKADPGERIIEILRDYVSRVEAQTLFARSLRNAGISGALDENNVGTFLTRLETNAAPYVPGERRRELSQRLAQLREATGRATPILGTETVEIASENDIVVARTRARVMCEALSAKTVAAHKVATVVSELARNIVSYTPGGRIELTPSNSPPTMTIRSIDRGTGIKNLDAIMGGSYRSKTGLGLGLSGSKRLASHFDIQTGPSGTTILVKMPL